MIKLLISIVFIIGYTAIITESKIRVNKAASALLAGSLCWTLFILSKHDKTGVFSLLMEHMGSVSSILFFLLGAMTIVEMIDSHNGFDIITERISTGSQRKLLWIIGFITFFLSAILDNLTTTIVMISLIKKIIHEERDRWFFAGIIIIAANAGGAWSPMGDVTTTMLWINTQISAANIVRRLFIPSIVCMIIPVIAASFMVKPGKPSLVKQQTGQTNNASRFEQNIIFFSGMMGLLLVPVFTSVTGLPPFIGMMGVLGMIWLITEAIHRGKPEIEKRQLSVTRALRRIDTATILFFLGILLCISAMQSSGILEKIVTFLSQHITNQRILILMIGLSSAIIDNVPLIAAVQAMYPISLYPTDHFLWVFLAYASGTGGSILIIGSAAGVSAMGLEKITFTWFLKHISLLAFIGYLAGSLVFLLQNALL